MINPLASESSIRFVLISIPFHPIVIAVSDGMGFFMLSYFSHEIKICLNPGERG